MKVEAYIVFPSGQVERWIFEYEDRDERIDFARRSEAALRAGASITTKAVQQ